MDKILFSAEKLFRKYGTRSISMDDIAHHLGMSKKTIYESFADKSEIVDHIVKLIRKELEHLINNAIEEPANPVQKLTKSFFCISSMIKDTNPSLLYDLQKHHESAWRTLLQFKEEFLIHKITDTLKEGIEKRYFKTEINTNVYAIYFLEVMSFTNNEKLFPKSVYSEELVSNNIVDFLLSGIVTEKGKKAYEKLIPINR
ncbi:MAG: TetR/AcrR family transcriptional regulator [Cyclobacteriaceae bacterium]|nr:TetR/AcrR family transcriptional regulator [Cyclobacteriaceae bacterium]